MRKGHYFSYILVSHYESSLVAQLVKIPPAMRETWVRSLGQEDPLAEGLATHSSILTWRISTDRGAWRVMNIRGEEAQAGSVTFSLSLKAQVRTGRIPTLPLPWASGPCLSFLTSLSSCELTCYVGGQDGIISVYMRTSPTHKYP